MKRPTVVFVILWMVVTATAVMAGAGAQTVRTRFQVEGMHCDGCSATIKGALERIEGVVSAEANHETGTAIVVHDSKKVPVEELKVAIEKLGYTVKSSETTAVDE